MAFVKFRGNTVTPAVPVATTANNAPLTNVELDGNFRSINDSLETTVTALDSLTTTVGTKANINSPTFTGTVGGITKAMVGLNNVDNTADASKTVLSATSSGSTRVVSSVDTRAVVDAPNYGVGIKADFKSNTTDGLNDGGSFHGVLTFQQYADATGGGTRQLGFTDNNNLWIRGSGTALTAFGSWKQILDSGNYNSYAPSLTGTGASGSWNITAALATNMTGGAGGQILYQSAAGVTTRLPNGNLGQYLASNGGTAAPSWSTVTIPTANNGTLGAAASAAGATNTTVVTNFSGAYSANTASNVTVNVLVGPSLTNLATTMTGVGAGYLRKTAADTYTIDTNTINDGALTVPAASAGATNTTIGLTLSGAFSANSSVNRTINTTVGPALTNLASAMTGAGSGFVRKTAADTYSIDTTAYAPLTGFGASGTWSINISGGAATASAVAWSGITSKPTTISDYGITDAITTANIGSQSVANSSNINITNNAASASTVYPSWVTATGFTGVNISTTKMTFVPSTGNLTLAGDVTAFSDERLKTNWRSLPYNIIDNLADVKSGIFDRIDAPITQVGVSAQSLNTIMPNAISTSEDGTLSVAYGNAALALCVEMAKEIRTLKKQISLLEK